MSKRTLIFIGVAILAIFATYLSYKYDKENQEQEPEPEPEQEPEAKTEPEPEPEPEPKKNRSKPVKAELIPQGNEFVQEETAGS